MRILIITKDLADNSTGRTYALWLMVKQLGWDAQVIALTGDDVWAPVATPEFTAACSRLDRNDPRWDGYTEDADLILAVKALPGSFGVARKLARKHGRPLLLDIDDPDVDAILSRGDALRAAAKMVLRAREFWPTLALRRHIHNYPVIVSNPTLKRQYGGTVIPHVRFDSGSGDPHLAPGPRVVFVGTNRPHKGVPFLRAAVRQLTPEGFTLTVTDRPPEDAEPWEEWVGPTSLPEGIELVKHGDIVVIPSLDTNPYSRAQLPVKLVDAMLAGRAIAVADFEPLTWAVGDGGLTFRPGDPESLEKVLRRLADPAVRTALGHAARRRALEEFTVDAVAPRFESACRTARGH